MNVVSMNIRLNISPKNAILANLCDWQYLNNGKFLLSTYSSLAIIELNVTF